MDFILNKKRLTATFESNYAKSNSYFLSYFTFVFHYANMPMEYAATFKDCKNDIFQMKNCDVFLIFALKHRLWVLVKNRLNEAVLTILTSTHNICFRAYIRN